MHSSDNHTFFTVKEKTNIRERLGEYAEVIMPSDIHFIIKHTGISWNTAIKYLIYNNGNISATITELQR